MRICMVLKDSFVSLMSYVMQLSSRKNSQNIKSGPIEGSSGGGPIEEFVFLVLDNCLILTLIIRF